MNINNKMIVCTLYCIRTTRTVETETEYHYDYNYNIVKFKIL